MTFLGYFGRWAIVKFQDFYDGSIMLGLIIQSIIINGLKATSLILRIIIRQFRFTTLDALFLLSLIGIFFGFVIISQFYSLLNDYISTKVLSRIIIVFVFREIGPLIVAMLVIGRSASAITVELGNLKINKQIELLEASGIDVIHLLVIPRIIAMIISCSVLTFIFNFFCFVGGIGLGKITGILPISFQFTSILEHISKSDALMLLIKPVVFGFIISLCATFYGINRARNVNDIPKSATWAIVHSILFCFIFNLFFMIILPSEL